MNMPSKEGEDPDQRKRVWKNFWINLQRTATTRVSHEDSEDSYMINRVTRRRVAKLSVSLRLPNISPPQQKRLHRYSIASTSPDDTKYRGGRSLLAMATVEVGKKHASESMGTQTPAAEVEAAEKCEAEKRKRGVSAEVLPITITIPSVSQLAATEPEGKTELDEIKGTKFSLKKGYHRMHYQ